MVCYCWIWIYFTWNKVSKTFLHLNLFHQIRASLLNGIHACKKILNQQSYTTITPFAIWFWSVIVDQIKQALITFINSFWGITNKWLALLKCSCKSRKVFILCCWIIMFCWTSFCCCRNMIYKGRKRRDNNEDQQAEQYQHLSHMEA